MTLRPYVIAALFIMEGIINFSQASKVVWSMANTQFWKCARDVQVLLEVIERPCCSYRSIRELNGNCPFAVFAGGGQDKDSAQLGEGRENIPPTSQSTTKKRRKLFQKPSSVASLLSPATLTVS